MDRIFRAVVCVFYCSICLSQPFIFCPTTTSLIIKKKKRTGAAILPSKFFRALLAAALGLSATSQRPFQCLTASSEHLQRKQRTSDHYGLDCLCPQKRRFISFGFLKVHPELKFSEALSQLGKNTLVDYVNWMLLFFVVVVIGNFLFFESHSIEKKPFLGKIPIKKFLEHPLEAHE